MNLFQAIIYGFISGLSEFLPISSLAHRRILQHLYGSGSVPLLDIIVHIAILAALITACFPALSRMHREQQRLASRRHRQNAQAGKSTLELRLLKTAVIPMCIGMLILLFIVGIDLSFPAICILLIVNGLILLLADHIRHGNKDVLLMSRLDSFFIGIAGALSILPGISGIGIRATAAEIAGADRQNAFHWSLLLCIPGLIIMGIASGLQIASSGFESFSFLSAIYYICASISAYIGAYLSIQLMRILIIRSSVNGFAYYSWGAALFTFILYLI